MQATLRTDRLVLVPLTEDHVDDLVELDSDPEVMRFLTGPPSTREDVERSYRARIARYPPGLGFWAGSLDDEFVGWWLLRPPDPTGRDSVDGEAELGYRLRRCFWRRGLASEGARELVRHGFDDLGLTRIYGKTMAVNAASRATMASMGMRHVRTFHVDWDDPLPGSELGEVEYRIDSDTGGEPREGVWPGAGSNRRPSAFRHGRA